jgi:hypothetical protein
MNTARLVLTPEQTAALVAASGGGEIHGRAWAVVAPGSWPTAPGRLVLHVVECPSMKAANGACAVAQGLSRAVALRIATKCGVSSLVQEDVQKRPEE